MMTQERRRFRRKLYCVPVMIRDAQKGTFYVDHVTDISEGGLLIHTLHLHAPGERIQVAFRFPDSIRWIEAECEVVWSTLQEDVIPAMGLRFVSLSDDDREYIRRYVEKEEQPVIDDLKDDLE